jgi:hypothetical protein
VPPLPTAKQTEPAHVTELSSLVVPEVLVLHVEPPRFSSTVPPAPTAKQLEVLGHTTP